MILMHIRIKNMQTPLTKPFLYENLELNESTIYPIKWL